MKISTGLVIILFLAAAGAKAQWQKMTTNVAYDFESIVFTDDRTGFAASVGNPLIKTADGGATWSYVAGVTAGNSLSFANTSIGYMAGPGNAMRRTTDGGASWTYLTSPTTNSVRGVAALDAYTAIFICVGGQVWKTSDAGAHWLVQTMMNDMRAICFVNSTTGYICDDANVYKTTDAGKSWTRCFNNTTYTLNSIYFADASTGYLVGNGSTLMKTTDGGMNWIKQDIGVGYSDLYCVKFSDASKGIITGNGGLILTTTDGGNNWKKAKADNTYDLNSIALINGSKGLVAGNAGVVLSNNDIYAGLPTQQAEEHLISVYPNPASNEINISRSGGSISDAWLEIYDIAGRPVCSQRLNEMEATVKIPLIALAKGIYTYRVSSPSAILATGKVVKK